MQEKNDDFHKEVIDISSVQSTVALPRLSKSMHWVLKAQPNIRFKVTMMIVLLERRNRSDQ